MVSYETIAVKLLSDADVNVSVVAQNFLMVKMARRSFGRKKNYGLTVTVLSPGGARERILSWRENIFVPAKK